MKIMVDILIRSLENNIMDVKKGEQIINTLEAIMSSDEYQKCKHKADYLIKLNAELAEIDEVPAENFDLLQCLIELVE